MMVAAVACLGLGCSGSADSGEANKPEARSQQPAANVPAAAPNSTVANALPPSVAQRLNNKLAQDAPVSGTPPSPSFQPAAEDSEIATTMGPNGSFVEIRVFKSHPQLAKVEATWLDARTKALKIYLRDGRIVDKTSDRIPNLKQTTAAELLALAGVKVSQAAPPGATAAKP